MKIGGEYMPRRSNEQTGNGIHVEVAAFGGRVNEVLLQEGATVADALGAAGFPTDSEVKCNGETYAPTDLVEEGDSLIVVAANKPKGGKN